MHFRDELLGLIAQKKRALVVGLGMSGIATARFLSSLGIETVCVERRDEVAYAKESKFPNDLTDLVARGVKIALGVDGEGVVPYLDNVGLAVLSPGVSLESSICGVLKRHSIRLLSELELGIELARVPSIIVTGSNGKSTTVSLIQHLLQAAGIRSRLCGNVGIPVIDGISASMVLGDEKAPEDVFVVEASSYQLESCSVIKPRVAIFLNISDNHLERHGTLERYRDVKARLFRNQDSKDVAVLNAHDPFVSPLSARVPSRVQWFGNSSATEKREGAWVEYQKKSGHDLLHVVLSGKTVGTIDVSGSVLIGGHNRHNMAASVLAALELGAPVESLKESLLTFTPLEHRLELVTNEAGLPLVVNDSKSTTVAASVAAVTALREAYPGRKLRLMIGGLAKAGSWEPLMQLLAREASCLEPVVCFGKDSNILASHCRASNIDCIGEKTLQAATERAISGASSEEVVLLSPGCASFDQFKDFEERGSVFKSLVRSLTRAEMRAAAL